jgi:hypothetical protein
VLSSLRKKSWFDNLAGFIVAYVFVLQALTGVIATQMAFARILDKSALCYGLDAPAPGSDGAAHHLFHPVCDICVFASMTPDIPEPAGSVIAFAYPRIAFVFQAFAGTSSSFLQSPRLSQGPPPIV